MVKDPPSVPPGQQRLGVPEVRAVEIKADWTAVLPVQTTRFISVVFNSLHRRGRIPGILPISLFEVITYRFIGFYIDPVSR